MHYSSVLGTNPRSGVPSLSAPHERRLELGRAFRQTDLRFAHCALVKHAAVDETSEEVLLVCEEVVKRLVNAQEGTVIDFM